MSELDDLLAEKARRAALQQQQSQPAPPSELQNQLAQKAQAQAMNPQQGNAGLDIDAITKALNTSGKKSSKGGKESVNTYDYEGRQIDVSKYAPYASVSQATKADDILKKSSTALKQINNINKKIKELKKMDKANSISMANPYIGKYVNSIRDIGANTMGIDEKQMVLRKQLESEMARMRLSADTALKGAGPLAEKMYAKFEEMNLHPNLINEGFPVTEAKLKDLEKDLKGLKVGAEMSLKTNRSIPYDDIESLIEAQEDEKQVTKELKEEVKKESAPVAEDRKKTLLEQYNSDPDNAPFLGLSDEAKLRIMSEAGDL